MADTVLFYRTLGCRFSLLVIVILSSTVCFQFKGFFDLFTVSADIIPINCKNSRSESVFFTCVSVKRVQTN